MFEVDKGFIKNYYAIYNNPFIESIHEFCKKNLNQPFDLFFQLVIKFILFIGLIYVIDLIFYRIIKPFLSYSFKKINFEKGKVLFDYRVINSFLHLIPIFIAYKIFPYFFYHHPKSFTLLNYLIIIALVAILTQFLFRFINSLEDLINKDNASYNNIAIRSFSQLAKIVIIMFNGFLIISFLFGVEIKAVLTILGTLTAVILFVFKDSILGFVAGIQISSSKMIKVGDWINLPKYNLEGYVKEINLITTKILNLDKTISNIPTYDLISSEVRNFSPMHQSQARQIKRSIIFKMSSFDFLDENLYNQLYQIDLIKLYLEKARQDINKENKLKGENLQLLINGRQLTNIGVFRKYIYEFLSKREEVLKTELIVVRQLQATPQGLPLEIICYINDTKWERFEKIQSDIFDHLLTAAKEFKLDISQTSI